LPARDVEASSTIVTLRLLVQVIKSIFSIAQSACLHKNYEQKFAIKLDVWQRGEAGFFATDYSLPQKSQQSWL
jgi:hypothetical protein